MKIKELRKLLQAADVASEDLDALVAMLAEIDDAEVSDLVPSIRSGVKKLSATLEKKRRAREEVATDIEKFVSELQATKQDNKAFEAVILRIKKARSIKAPEITEIANRFLGSDREFKSKADAARVLLKRQIDDKRALDRQAKISEIF